MFPVVASQCLAFDVWYSSRTSRNGWITIIFLLFASFLSAPIFCETNPVPKNRHVVVVVWDGMRPDFVSERNTPALWKLAREGVTFRHHHSVYPTATNVNSAAIATGVYPNRNGLLANREYRPQIDPQRAVDTGELEIIRKGDASSGGKYLALPTIAEIVHAAGCRSVIVGAKSAVFSNDRHAEWTSAVTKASQTTFAAAPMPRSVREKTLRLLGPFISDRTNTSDQRNAYATRALIDILWCDGLPALSVLWLSEPDLTQHEYSPGSDPSMAAVRSSDRNLAAILELLSKKQMRETTDILVVSDHGFSTIERGIDFPSELCAAGFDAVTTFEQEPKTGQVMVVGNGGTILFYVVEHDRAVTSKLVEWLQYSNFAGVISRETFEGTFPLESVRANTADAPDVMVALRWSQKANRFGIPGQIFTDATRSTGNGSHATLSEFDVHNMLVAAGPEFRRAMLDDLPSGNADLAPTILHLLRLEPPHKLDGRILSEAMTGDSAPLQAVAEVSEVTRKFPSGQWRQHLHVSRVGETFYLDEGNGAFETR